jgi:hypothetical protein
MHRLDSSLNLYRLPSAATCCWDATLIQRLGDPTKAGNALSPDRLDDWQKVTCESRSLRFPFLGRPPPAEFKVFPDYA